MYNLNLMFKKFWKKVTQYFLQGLFYTAPIGITIYLLVVVILFIDSLFNTEIPGIGILAALFIITVIGWIATRFIHKPILQTAEKVFEKTPLIKIIYSSVKDLVSAFLGQKKKFDKPVLVQLDAFGLERLGFIMEENLEFLGLPNTKVAVYVPMSVSIAGDLFIVDSTRVKPLDASSTEVMKFIVSGGLTS